MGLSDMRLRSSYKRQDLRPVGILGSSCFVMNSGDGGL